MADGINQSREVPRAEARRSHTVGTLRLDRLAVPLLLAAGFFAYHNALHGPFVLDDIRAISQNESIRRPWPLWGVLSPPLHSPVTGRPLVNLSLALNHALGGERVTSYHAFNLAIHLLAALALFGVIRRTLSRSSRYREEATALATTVALLWVVHPLTTESVNYTIQRTELLMGLSFLLTLYCAIRGFGPPERLNWYGAALGAFVLGLGSKEVIVVAPGVVLVYDWLFDSASLRNAVRRHWRLYAGYAAVLGLYILFVGTRLRGAFTGLRGRAVDPWDYALTQSTVIVHYLRLALWPHPLAADYDGWPIATSPGSVLPYLAVVVALTALTLWGLVRKRKLALLGVWFFLILAPTSSFRPISTEIAAERRMYLPLASVVVLGVLGGHALLTRIEARKGVGIVSVTALAMILSIVTLRRNEIYQTTLSFWTDAVAKRPDNARARIWLAKDLRARGSNVEALQHLVTAVHLQPRNGDAQYGLGVALASEGRIDEAITHYREALRINPQDVFAHNNLGAALADRGEIGEAVDHYRTAIRINPSHAGAHYNLALQLARRGSTSEAIEYLEAAIRLNPHFAPARLLLDELRRGAGR